MGEIRSGYRGLLSIRCEVFLIIFISKDFIDYEELSAI
jgi:hypothetical protein